jgi:transcriptional regulator GlxA family with amidase domain
VLATILFVTADWPTGIAFSITVERFARIFPVATISEAGQTLAERAFGLVIVDQSRTDDDLRPLLKAARDRACNVLVVSGREARGPIAIRALVDRAANALASHLGRPPEPRPPGRYVSQAIEEIRGNYRAPLTVSGIARAIHVSPSHLAHRFRSETGMTVKEYVTRVRVEMARRMLLETDAKLESIADAVGFCDAPHLSRVFVQYTRQRPGEYRRRPA